jgi:hypothetical protein
MTHPTPRRVARSPKIAGGLGEWLHSTSLILTALFLIAPGSQAAASEEVKPPDITPPDTWVPRTQGSVRVMNKIDSTVQLVTLQVGQTVTYQSLALSLSGCFVRPDDLPADAAAHLRIVDNHPDAPGFDGWMLKREPSLNMLQNPVYDVQLAGCG